MPGFCINCGAPLAAAFCTRCGQRAQTPVQYQPAPSPQPVSQPAPEAVAPAPAAASPSTPSASTPATVAAPTPNIPAPEVTIPQPGIPSTAAAGVPLLIIGGIILVFCLAAFGVVLYGVHWVKGKVAGLTGGAIGTPVRVTQGNACTLLSLGELQQVLGVTVEKNAEIMEGNDPGCAYYTNTAAFTELQKMAMEQARRDSERVSKEPGVKNSKSDNPLELLKHTEEMEGMVKGLGALQQPDKDGRVFAFSVDRNFGAENWGPLRTTLALVPGFKEIDGVGDHAMLGSFGHAFYVLKGNSMVHLDTMYVPETRMRGAELGRKIVSHM
jgi:hypothetical protein